VEFFKKFFPKAGTLLYTNCTNTYNTDRTERRRVDMFELDIRSRQPIYEQLVEKLKELIMNKILKVDEQLPSVRTLAQQLTINPNTIQKAYRELERQGYIYSVPGKGSFVSESSSIINNEKLEKVKQELLKILSEAVYLGITKEDIVTLFEKIDETVKGGESLDDTSK
jgi:GntR family transcriptional regulator